MNVSVVAVSTQLKDYLFILVFVTERLSHKTLLYRLLENQKNVFLQLNLEGFT